MTGCAGKVEGVETMPRLAKVSGERRRSGSSIAEFAPALLLLIPVLIFFISLFWLLLGFATVQLAAQLGVREAASAASLAQARQLAEGTVFRIQMGPGTIGGMVGFQQINTPALTVVEIPPGEEPRPFNPAAGVDPDNTYQFRLETGGTVKPVFFPNPVPVRGFATSIVENPEGLTVGP